MTNYLLPHFIFVQSCVSQYLLSKYIIITIAIYSLSCNIQCIIENLSLVFLFVFSYCQKVDDIFEKNTGLLDSRNRKKRSIYAFLFLPPQGLELFVDKKVNLLVCEFFCLCESV